MSSGKIWFDKELIEYIIASHIYQKRNNKGKNVKQHIFTSKTCWSDFQSSLGWKENSLIQLQA